MSLSAIRERLLGGWQERTFLKKSATVLSARFPNPNREACPGMPVLRRMAAGTMPLKEAAPFLQHLGFCSDCFQDFTQWKQADGRRRMLKLRYAALALSIVTALGVWWISAGLRGYPQIAVLDLRGQSPSRGITVPAPDGAAPVPEVSRFTRSITILLSIGAEGRYDITFRQAGIVVAAAQARTVATDSAVALTFPMDLKRVRPGILELSLHPDSGESLSFQVRLK